jgi:hypothetical protein
MASTPKKATRRGTGRKKSARLTAIPRKSRLYRLKVSLLSGPITKKFAKKNRAISRMILIRGNQTLEDLHVAIFDAFDRFDEHMYEFQFGKGPMDPDGLRYVLPMAFEDKFDYSDNRPAGRVDQTTIDSLALTVDQPFGYWFDFGDDWWHQIDVESIEDMVPPGEYPKVTERVGKSPPQYMDMDDEE